MSSNIPYLNILLCKFYKKYSKTESLFHVTQQNYCYTTLDHLIKLKLNTFIIDITHFIPESFDLIFELQ